MWIREAQKHIDPTDPDPDLHHWEKITASHIHTTGDTFSDVPDVSLQTVVELGHLRLAELRLHCRMDTGPQLSHY